MEEKNTTLFGLNIDPTGKGHLLEAAKWAKFLSIVAFVCIGLFALMLIFAGPFITSMFEQMGGGYDQETDRSMQGGMAIALIVYYLIVFVIVFLAYLFLYRFAVNMRMALDSNDQDRLNRSFMYLKVLYRYWGILTIIGLVFFVIFAIIGIIAGTAMQ